MPKNKKFQHILFDLDGTLVDTGEGIINSARYTLLQLGISENDNDRLASFVGPPLKEVFMHQYQMSDEDAASATRLFREYYGEVGKYQCHLYDGIGELLFSLKAKGYDLYVATSKPTEFAIDILEKCAIKQAFRDIIGSNMDNSRSKKKEVIQYLFQKNQILNLQEVLMVGDKAQDLIGARECGIAGLGVLYGYGDYLELNAEPHVALIQSPEELLGILE